MKGPTSHVASLLHYFVMCRYNLYYVFRVCADFLTYLKACYHFAECLLLSLSVK